MNPVVADCLAGRISAPVAVSRLLLGGADGAAIAAAVQAAEQPGPAWHALAALVAGRTGALDRLAGEIRQTGSDHSAMGSVERIAGFFDRAVAHSPEAGVALYSLGDPALLDAATREIVSWLATEGLLHPEGDVLDLGCGIGRVAGVLAGRCRTVLGVDVSAGMVAEAQRRHGSSTGLRFAVTDGSTVPPGPFDLVLAVDSMPYAVQAGVADAVVTAAGERLRPGGALAVLNLSYGRTRAQDVADAQRWAAGGLSIAMAGATPFSIWDGTAWVWRKCGGPRPTR